MNNPTQSVPLQHIGRYEVQGELGHGAMGIVYKAVDPNIGRTVALKTMRMDVNAFDHDELLRRFKNEARAAGVLNHPNIVTIYDADEAHGLFYIAMEYLEGRTLESILAENRSLPVERVIEIVRQIVSGLDYAHAANVIHRDIKPANILITRQGLVKIMDFGIAKSGAAMATSASSVLGTPNYMSPEQVRGRHIDGRSDFFSLGVILYQMITGERPFAGDNVTTVIYKIVNEKPVSPRDVDVSIHPGLSAVVTKCLAKEPNDRYQSGAALLRDLESYKNLMVDENATTALTSEEAARGASIPNEVTTIRAAAQTAAGVGAAAPANTKFIGNLPLPPRSASPVSKPQIQPMATMPLRVKGDPAKQDIQETVYRGTGLSRNAWRFIMAVIVGAIVVLGFQLLPPAQKARINRIWRGIMSTVHGAPDPGNSNDTSAVLPPIVPAQPANNGTAPVSSPNDDENGETADVTVRKNGRSEKEAAHGKIKINSKPIDAVAVITDGRDDSECSTPCIVGPLKPGMHKFTFVLNGYNTMDRTIAIKPGENDYTVTMTPSGATLIVTSIPKGAAINLDGKDTGEITPHQFSVVPGAHAVILTKQDFQARGPLSFNVQAGEMKTVPGVLPLADGSSQNAKDLLGRNKRISQGKGVLRVVTNPAGANVILNGVNIGKSNNVERMLPATDYQLKVSLQGYRDQVQNIHVDEGQTTLSNIDLQPK